MQAVVRERYGEADVVRLADLPTPVADGSRILIRMHAVSLNGSDWEAVTGRPAYVRITNGLRRPRQPQLGSDIAGIVEAVGSDVTRFAPGDPVFGDLLFAAPRCLSEFVEVEESAPLARMPDGLDPIEASCLPQAGILARQALREVKPITAGDRILVIGGGGGAGTLTIQLALHLGAIVDGVDRAAKLELMRGLGATEAFDFEVTDALGGSRRYDRIVDFVGRRSIRDARRALTDDGIYLMVGGTVPRLLQAVIGGALTTARSARTVKVLAARTDEDRLLEVADLVLSGAMRPIIDSTIPLSEGVAAFERLGSGAALGKVVVTAS